MDNVYFYGVKARDGRLPVSALSGGNQQKVVIARVLHQDPDVLIAAQPTRGVDLSLIHIFCSITMMAVKPAEMSFLCWKF